MCCPIFHLLTRRLLEVLAMKACSELEYPRVCLACARHLGPLVWKCDDDSKDLRDHPSQAATARQEHKATQRPLVLVPEN